MIREPHERAWLFLNQCRPVTLILTRPRRPPSRRENFSGGDEGVLARCLSRACSGLHSERRNYSGVDGVVVMPILLTTRRTTETDGVIVGSSCEVVHFCLMVNIGLRGACTDIWHIKVNRSATTASWTSFLLDRQARRPCPRLIMLQDKELAKLPRRMGMSLQGRRRSSAVPPIGETVDHS